jgi:(E)-4-hydroxy-3-methylbut-2-enyl-diphosphate synthase
MEFLRVARDRRFNDIVVSVKASNVVVMVNTVRLLARRMADEGMSYPFHLGVTEAGDADDGRIKSAVGIGALLSEGIGDTIRVSLSENPVNEIPVARIITDYIARRADAEAFGAEACDGYNPLAPERLLTGEAQGIGGGRPTAIVSNCEYTPTETITVKGYHALTPEFIAYLKSNPTKVLLLEAEGTNVAGEIQSIAHTLLRAGVSSPMIARLVYNQEGLTAEQVKIYAAVDAGTLLLNGLRDGISIDTPYLTDDETYELALTILQATRLRISRTEYIACPGCGRTLFSLQDTLHAVKAATAHLKGLKIGVMGCIVNGPGEMADADYGYVGAAAGHISLYKGKTCVAKNLPQEEAIPHLIALIKENGDWVEPA